MKKSNYGNPRSAGYLQKLKRHLEMQSISEMLGHIKDGIEREFPDISDLSVTGDTQGVVNVRFNDDGKYKEEEVSAYVLSITQPIGHDRLLEKISENGQQ